VETHSVLPIKSYKFIPLKCEIVFKGEDMFEEICVSYDTCPEDSIITETCSQFKCSCKKK
jgi:hypothetical protein